jgi:pimeloyl-ACP methyl ester carboxylesterase
MTRRELSPAYEEATRNAVSTTEVNLHFMPILAGMDLRPGLAAARCPVLVLAGEHDPLSPPAVVAEIVSALPEGLGELHVVRGASHRVLWDEAETAHALLREFVERVTEYAPSASA